MWRVLLLVMVVWMSVSLSATQFRVEATAFSQRTGKWQEGKSVGNTGNTYLLGLGKHSQLKDSFTVPKAGKYTVWAYTVTMRQGGRINTVIINGNKLGSFGDAKAPELPVNAQGWYFEKVGAPIDLAAGKMDVVVDGESGYGRFDFLIFSDDEKFVPGGVRSDWEKIPEAARATGVEAVPQAAAALPSASGKTTFRLEATAFASREGKFQVGKSVLNTGNEYMMISGAQGRLTDSFVAPAAGTYTVWAYTLTMKQGGRRYKVVVNGQELGVFGDSKEPGPTLNSNGWYFEKLGKTITLPAGKFDVSLISYGGWGRVDFLIFSSDPSYQPGNGRKEWEAIPELKSMTPPSPQTMLPKSQGKGPSVLMMHGGRPWVAGDTTAFLVASGLCVTKLDSVYLDGMGGASIKRFLSDKVEPKAKDGITPAMKCLKDYRLLFVTGIPEAMEKKIFTPERVAAVKAYVEQGGVVVLTFSAPALEELLPVVYKGAVAVPPEQYTVMRGDRPAYAELPVSWPHIGLVRPVELREGSTMIMPLLDKNGKMAGVFAAERRIGKGKVIFINTDWRREQGMRQLFAWAYGKALITSLISDSIGVPLKVERTIYKVPVPPVHQELASATVTVMEPEMRLENSNGKATVGKNEFTLSNGIRAVIDDNGKLSMYWPGQKVPFVRGMAAPCITLSAALANVDSATSELKEGEFIGEKVLAGNWVFKGMSAVKDGVVLTYLNGDTELAWTFTAGKLCLDGRDYIAFAEQPTVVRCPYLIQSVKVESQVVLGEDTTGHNVWRMSCYSSPRGFAQYDFSGKSDQDTMRWGLFSSGQPFTWVFAPNGIYSEFVDAPVASECRLFIKKGDKSITNVFSRTIGYMSAPCSVPRAWHAYSAKPQVDNNEWMAMYQFQRLHLRNVVGLPSLPPLPTMTWQNTSSQQEIEAALAAGKKLGFRRVALPLCPSNIQSLATEQLHTRFKSILSHGMIPFPWSAGDYFYGKDDEILLAHPDWFVHDQAGKVHFYDGSDGHPVVDLNNKEFQKWYFNILDSAINAGMGAIYFDMYGTAIGNINYARKNSPAGLQGGIEIFQYLLKRGVTVGVEGQNPLAHDNWWYRQSKYTAPFQGKEFSILCASPSSGICGDDMALDYFRTSMYCTFLYINTDGYPKRFERTAGENAFIERMGRLNPYINRAIDATGYPFIRDTSFGTTWIGKNGGALFFYHGVKDVTVNLPKGWAIEGVKGNRLTDVKPESIYILKRSVP